MMWHNLNVHLWSLVCALQPLASVCPGYCMYPHVSLEYLSPEITKSSESKSISNITSMKLYCSCSRGPFLTFVLDKWNHLEFTGRLLYHSSKLWKERTKNKMHCLDLLVLHFEDYNVGFDKASISSFSLLSRQQPNSQGVLSAPYCNTSRGDWQTNRCGCHMFVKESAKCSLQLTNSSDIFPLSDSLSLSPAVAAARSIRERHMTC